MESIQIQNKINLLFQKMLEPNYIMNNYYADSLITKLSNCSDPEIASYSSMPWISDLVIEAITKATSLHNTVKVFLYRMLAIVSKKELHFAKIFAKQNDTLLAAFKEINSPNINSSLCVAYMEVALGIVNHNSGIFWLLQTGVWKEILSLCNEAQTVFVVRQTYKFVSKFLWSLNDLADEANIKTVLRFVLSPIFTIDFLKIESMTPQEETEIIKSLDPMLHILLSIVSEVNKIKKNNLIIHILFQEYTLNTYLFVVFDRMRNKDTTSLITKLTFWLYLGKIFLTKPFAPDVIYVKEDFMDLEVLFFNIMQLYIQRRSPILIMDFCCACSLIWNIVWQNTIPTWNVNGKKINLQNQILFMCLVPLLTFVYRLKNNVVSMSADNLNDFVDKLLNFSCEHTSRTAYAMRDLTLETDCIDLTLQGVKRLSCLRTHLNNEQANLVFQSLFYILREYVPNDDMSEEDAFDDCNEKIVILTYVLDTVSTLVKHHDINWHESLEIICLYTVVYNILKRSNLTCKSVIAALNVIALTIKKFLPPNLSLLMESKPGTTMHEIGKLIYMKMHDMNWEVRDSALELLLVCTEISYIKFPPFQKQLLNNNLINVAATMALNDHEFYVQASALKCLGAACKIASIWEQLKLQYPNIEDLLISILRNNQEGIVRKEACSVLCDIYQNVKLSPNFKQTLYDHMVSSALSDFHWEVQWGALKFWKIVISSFLCDQGMLDGKFPPVTFSRVTRKIVTLNDVEIRKRLLKTLDELSSIGCLTVLVKLLHDDSEIDIVDAALTVALDLIKILDKYNVPEFIKPNADDPASVDDLLCHIKEENYEEKLDTNTRIDPETSQHADNVIESILNADDINLLANIYERHMSLDCDKEDTQPKPRIKLLKCASPHLFVTFLKSKDFKGIIEQKRKWNDGIRSLPSLLDDVLGIYEVNEEVNNLDCY